MSYLRYLCLFAHSGVQHLFCCVFVFLRLVHPMLPVSLDCPFFTAPQVFFNVYWRIINYELSNQSISLKLKYWNFTVLIKQFIFIYWYLTKIMKSKYLLQPSRPDRGWFVNPYSDHNPWWIMILTALPALVAVILIFMDQQITAVIINRKENKLKVYFNNILILWSSIF